MKYAPMRLTFQCEWEFEGIRRTSIVVRDQLTVEKMRENVYKVSGSTITAVGETPEEAALHWLLVLGTRTSCSCGDPFCTERHEKR